MNFPPLPPSFYARTAELVAPDLLGKLVLRRTREGLAAGRIVEAEAYLPAGDPACHAARGQTPRNTAMFGPPGRAYVYSIHSRWCLNAVTDAEGTPSAVLIRALEPLAGIPLMQRRRGSEHLLDLARGPARLCQALAIDRRQNTCDLTTRGGIWIAADASFSLAGAAIGVSPRIGVTSAHDLPLRYFLDGSRYVSGPRKHHSRMLKT